MRKSIKKYLEALGYDVNNPKGSSCWILNIIDIFLLLFYIGIVIYNTWLSIAGVSNNISDLTYMATAILSCRTLIKFWIKERTLKKDGISITITYTVGIVIYLFLTSILIFCNLFFSNEELSKLLLIIYYILFAIFELTEILTRCFDAEPHKYKR